MLRVVATLACAIVIVAPARSFAGAPKCRANDPAAAADAAAVSTVRQQIDTSCPCASFTTDGKKSRHRDYVKCAKGVVKAAIDADQLRKQCKTLALYRASLSTCGYPATLPQTPCLKATKKGPVCKISKCQGPKDLPCAKHTNCLAAADTNRDAQVTALDSGQCNPWQDCAAQVTLPQWYIDNAVINCFDGCTNPLSFQECIIGCAAGGGALSYVLETLSDVCRVDPTLGCEDLHAAYLERCTTMGVPPMCLDNCYGDLTCQAKCEQVVSCTGAANVVYANCLAAQN